MKVFNVTVFLISVSYFAFDGHCGVIDNVYGSARHGTQSVRDQVNDWWFYGKDMLFGSDSNGSDNGNTSVTTVEITEDSLLGRIYNSVSNRYYTARRKLHELLIDQENGKDKSIVSTMYGRVSKRISQLSLFLKHDAKVTEPSKTNQDVVALKEVLSKFLKRQQEKKYIDQVHNTINNGIDKSKMFGENASRRVGDSIRTTNSYVDDKVETVKDNFGVAYNDIIKNKNDLSENKMLMSISTRLRNRMSNITEDLKSTGQNLTQLTYDRN